MSDFLGKLENQLGRLVAEVRPHPYEKPPKRRSGAFWVVDPYCARCGYHVDAHAGALFVHPDDATYVPERQANP